MKKKERKHGSIEIDEGQENGKQMNVKNDQGYEYKKKLLVIIF